jgi:hypothetical protein
MIQNTRAMQLIRRPAKVWHQIAETKEESFLVVVKHILPWLLVPVTFTVLGYGLIGKSYALESIHIYEKGWGLGLQYALIYLLSTLSALVAVSAVMSYLSPVFKAQPNFHGTLILMAYSWTPLFLASAITILPQWAGVQMIAIPFSLFLIRAGAHQLTGIRPASLSVYALTAATLAVTIFFILYFLLFEPLVLYIAGNQSQWTVA